MRSLASFSLVLCLAAGCTTASSAGGEFKSLSFSLLEDYDKGDDLEEVARDFEVLRSLGVTTWRGSFGWDDYEPEAGAYDFEWLRAFATLAADHGIALRPYIAYTPDWAARGGADDQAWNDPPRSLESWRSFVARLAAALADRPNVLSYEIYNEQNTTLWWEGDVTDYIPVLRAAASAIRQHDHDADVIMGGLVWPDADWLREVCESDAAAFDIAAIHAYPETWTEPGVRVETYLGEQYSEFLEVATDTCGGKSVWINETGFATTPGKSERDQANWWARAIATFAAAPGVSHIGIYEIKDLPSDRPVIGDAPNYHLGILRTDRMPKLAFHTLRALVPLMSEAAIAPSPDAVRVSAAGVQHHFFRRSDGLRILFVWRTAGTDRITTDVGLARPARTITEVLLDGTRRVIQTGNRSSLGAVQLDDDVRVFLFDER